MPAEHKKNVPSSSSNRFVFCPLFLMILIRHKVGDVVFLPWDVSTGHCGLLQKHHLTLPTCLYPLFLIAAVPHCSVALRSDDLCVVPVHNVILLQWPDMADFTFSHSTFSFSVLVSHPALSFPYPFRCSFFLMLNVLHARQIMRHTFLFLHTLEYGTIKNACN